MPLHQILIHSEPIKQVLVGGSFPLSPMQRGSFVDALRFRFEAVGAGVFFVALDLSTSANRTRGFVGGRGGWSRCHREVLHCRVRSTIQRRAAVKVELFAKIMKIGNELLVSDRVVRESREISSLKSDRRGGSRQFGTKRSLA